jgi:hypothetical protein
MTNRDVACLTFKALAVWLPAQAAVGVASAASYLWEPQLEGIRLIAVASMLLPIVVAGAISAPLWLKAEALAAYVFPAEQAGPVDRSRVQPQAIFALTLAILGAVSVVWALPELASGIAVFVYSRSAGDSLLGPDFKQQALIWDATARAKAVAAIARLAIGAVLLAGPSRLAAAYSRVQREFRSTLADDGVPKDSGEPRG